MENKTQIIPAEAMRFFLVIYMSGDGCVFIEVNHFENIDGELFPMTPTSTHQCSYLSEWTLYDAKFDKSYEFENGYSELKHNIQFMNEAENLCECSYSNSKETKFLKNAFNDGIRISGILSIGNTILSFIDKRVIGVVHPGIALVLDCYDENDAIKEGASK